MAESDKKKGDDLYKAQSVGPAKPGTLQFIYDVELLVSVELGRNTIEIEQLLNLKKGMILQLSKLPEEPLDVRVNNKLVAQGEAVIVNDKFGVRVTQIISPVGELELTPT